MQDVGITYWAIAGTDLPGVLNLIAFCMDPALSNALSAIKLAMIDKYGDAASPNAKDHKFKAWITRTLFGTKRLHRNESSFYRMSANDNVDSCDTVTGIDPQNLPLTHYPATGTLDLSSSEGSTTVVDLGSRDYEMHWIGNADNAHGVRRRKGGDEQSLRTVFRGL